MVFSIISGEGVDLSPVSESGMNLGRLTPRSGSEYTRFNPDGSGVMRLGRLYVRVEPEASVDKVIIERFLLPDIDYYMGGLMDAETVDEYLHRSGWVTSGECIGYARFYTMITCGHVQYRRIGMDNLWACLYAGVPFRNVYNDDVMITTPVYNPPDMGQWVACGDWDSLYELVLMSRYSVYQSDPTLYREAIMAIVEADRIDKINAIMGEEAEACG
jgi:hypothetical protein